MRSWPGTPVAARGSKALRVRCRSRRRGLAAIGCTWNARRHDASGVGRVRSGEGCVQAELCTSALARRDRRTPRPIELCDANLICVLSIPAPSVSWAVPLPSAALASRAARAAPPSLRIAACFGLSSAVQATPAVNIGISTNGITNINANPKTGTFGIDELPRSPIVDSTSDPSVKK